MNVFINTSTNIGACSCIVKLHFFLLARQIMKKRLKGSRSCIASRYVSEEKLCLMTFPLAKAVLFTLFAPD